MPLYRCTVREGLTTEGQRAQIAKEIVRVHCEVTGAPPTFVLGTIRAGRTDPQKARIVSELTAFIASATGCRRDEVGVVTIDVPAKWVMEGGELLPEPGEEAEWLERHRPS